MILVPTVVVIVVAAATFPLFRAASREQDPDCQKTLVGVAHQDDDLLFINPEIRETVRQGCLVSTVYLTAGDDGNDLDYAANREIGARAAYAEMADVDNRWNRDDVSIGDRTISSFVLNSDAADVRLTFLRLPDGRPQGDGNSRFGGQSMLKLFTGEIQSIAPIDTLVSEGYSEGDLIGILVTLIELGEVSRVLTTDYDNASFGYSLDGDVDHSDHGIAARYIRKAAYLAAGRQRVRPYFGYALPKFDANLTKQQASDKTDVFNAYNKLEKCYDHPDLCRTPPLDDDYALWMPRHHQREHRAPESGEIMSGLGSTGATDAANTQVENCLDGGNPADIQVKRCDETDPQQWTFNGSSIRHKGSDQCLTASSETSVTVEGCETERPAQQWEPDSSGHLKADGRCLHQPDFARSDTRLRMADCAPRQPEAVWRWSQPQAPFSRG